MGELAFRFLQGMASLLVLALAATATEESCVEGQNCTAEDDHSAMLQWDYRQPCHGKTCGDQCVDWRTDAWGQCDLKGSCLVGKAPNCKKGHYCKIDPADYDCYEKGHPRCCTDGDRDNCPEKKPMCEITHVCAEKERSPCACNGTVYFGKKYTQGYPGYGDSIPLASLKNMREVVTKTVAAGEIECSPYGFQQDPAPGYFKQCFCEPAEALNTEREEKPLTSPPAPPSASYKLMKRAGCAGGTKYSYHSIETSTECEMAGKSLGLSTDTPRVIHDQWRPHGCHVKGDKKTLYFNVKGSMTTRSSHYPSICIQGAKKESDDPCKKMVCGETCVLQGDMAGICDAEGECSLDYGNVHCGAFKEMRDGTCDRGYQFIESKKECKTAAVALGMDSKVGEANYSRRPYGCYKYFKKDTGDARIVFNSAGTRSSKDTKRFSICSESSQQDEVVSTQNPCAHQTCGSKCSHGGGGIGITALSGCDVGGQCSMSLSDLSCEDSAGSVLVGVTSYWVHDDYDKDSWWNDKGDVYAKVSCAEAHDFQVKSQVFTKFQDTLEGDFSLWFYAPTSCGQLKLDIMDKDDHGSETIMSSEINLAKRGAVKVSNKVKDCDWWGKCNEKLVTDVTYKVYDGGAAKGVLRRLNSDGVVLTLPSQHFYD